MKRKCCAALSCRQFRSAILSLLPPNSNSFPPNAQWRFLRDDGKNSFMVLNQDTTEQLTPKEKEVLHMIAEGLSSKQIAAKLGLSENTIENHRKNMLRKTNCKNIAQLIRYATLNGLI